MSGYQAKYLMVKKNKSSDVSFNVFIDSDMQLSLHMKAMTEINNKDIVVISIVNLHVS